MARDQRDWMKSVERQLALYKGIPRIIADTIQIVREEIAAKDSRRPTAPIELTHQTAFYLDLQGRRRSRFLMDFPDVVKATDGTDITVDRYQLWGRDESVELLARTTSAVAGLAEPGITLPGLAATPWNKAISEEVKPWRLVSSNTESFFRQDGFIPGSVWRFRARAMGSGMATPGEWSAEIVVQMLEDDTPPPQPTAPTTSVERGTITVAWDGQSVLGPMPADFKYAILAHGTASSPTREIARFGRGGGFTVVADVPYYDPQFFRLAAVDESGNQGPWSEQVTAFTTPLVDTDIILSEIDAAKVHLKNIHAGVSILPDTIITEHLVVTEQMSATIGQFLRVKAGMLEVNEIWADEVWVGVADAKLVRSDMFIGKEFIGGKFTGTTFETDVEEYRGITWDASGITAYSPGGVQTFTLSAISGRAVVTGRVSTGAPGQPGVTLLPAEESDTGTTAGMFISQTGGLSGGVTAGAWVGNATSTGAQDLILRGMNGGGIRVEDGNMTFSANQRIGDFGAWAIGQGGRNYLPELEIYGDLTLHAHPTTSSAANAVIATNPYGKLFRSTSSLRYKTDVQDWSPGLAALGLRTRSWVDRNPMDPADPLKRYYGFIAEEVEQVLPEMITLNELGEPESVQYERIAAALVPVIVDMMGRIEALEGN